MKRYIILDRDGTIIFERYYLSTVAAVELLPNAASGLKLLAEMEFGLIMVTNQSGLARGYFDEASLEQIHGRVRELLQIHGVNLDAIYYCPHLPEAACDCRKPKPGMILRAAREFDFDPTRCIVIGDKPCDIHLGAAVGATTILVRTGYGAQIESENRHGANYVVDDLLAAAGLIRASAL